MHLRSPSFLLELAAIASGAALAAQNITPAPQVALGAPDTAAAVVYDEPGDGRLWALGTTYKASFGADGFTYVPFFGSAAPRNHPVCFVLHTVRIAGDELPFDAGAHATRSGDRVAFARGAVRETYDLSPTGVEQTFVVDSDRAGDVDVELAVATDLEASARPDGLQFCCELGHVDYGTAWLVRGSERLPVPMAWSDGVLRLHVPAAQRGAGPVVIDPLVGSAGLTPTLMNSTLPDLAYDASTNRWLATWVHVFSQTDHDVVAELQAADGTPVAGSFQILDISGVSFTQPRTANLNSAHRFLVAMERSVPSSTPQDTVWGCTVEAQSPFRRSPLFLISPNSNLNQNSVDVGGDPGNGNRWTVVWVHNGANPRAGDILARQVDASGAVLTNTIVVESQGVDCYFPSISLSNGNGLVASPRWCVSYSVQMGTGNSDPACSMIDLAGTVTDEHRLNNSTAFDDRYSNVSSPLLGLDGQLRFLIVYERQLTTSTNLAAQVVDATGNAVTNPIDLTQRYGFSGTFSRVESDGDRFAVVCRNSGLLQVGTLAFVNNDLVQHESRQSFANGEFPHIASKRSGGGPNTDYDIVYIDTGNPSRAWIQRYEGRSQGGGVARRRTGCGPFLDSTGRPLLGGSMQFALTGVGTDLPGFLVGLPVTTHPLCSTCMLGLDPAQSVLAIGAAMNLAMPRNAVLVGLTISVQGFALGSGPCNPAAANVSDTLDCTIL